MARVLIVALCLASAVALVSGQGLSWQRCRDAAMQTIPKYQSKLTESMQQFTSEITSSAQGSVNTQSIDTAMQEMITQTSQIVQEMQSSFDYTKMVNYFTNSLSMITRTAVSAFSVSATNGMFNSYVKLVNNLNQIHLDTFRQMVNSCSMTRLGQEAQPAPFSLHV